MKENKQPPPPQQQQFKDKRSENNKRRKRNEALGKGENKRKRIREDLKTAT